MTIEKEKTERTRIKARANVLEAKQSENRIIESLQLHLQYVVRREDDSI